MHQRTCFILDHLGVGGVQEFVLNYCKSKEPNSVICVVSIFKNDIYSKKLRKTGAVVIFLTNRPYSYISVLNPHSFFAFVSFYMRNRNNFDRINLKLFASFTYASIIGLWRSSKVSVGLDCNRNQLPLAIQIVFRMFARHYHRFYLNSLLIGDYRFLKLHNSRLRDQFYPVTRRQSQTPHVYPKTYSFLSVGRGIAQKGHAEATALFARVNDLLNGTGCLTILGDGPAIDELKTAYPGDGKTVAFPGSVENYDDWLIGASGIMRMALSEDVNSVIREGILAGKVVATTLEGPGCQALADQGLIVVISRDDIEGSAKRIAEAVVGMSDERRDWLQKEADRLWPQNQAFQSYD